MEKGFYFNEERFTDRFTWFSQKIVYKAVPAPALTSLFSPTPEAWEARLRAELNDLIRIRAYNTMRKPLVLFSTAEEIPSGPTIQLLKECEFPSPMHLQLKEFMYSFEWPIVAAKGGWSWRAQVHAWDEEMEEGSVIESIDGEESKTQLVKRLSGFTLDMVSDRMLADAGWHCINCFKKPKDLLSRLRGELSVYEGWIQNFLELIISQTNWGPRQCHP